MNKRALGITAVAVILTAVSVVIGARAIMGTAAMLRQTRGEGEAEPGNLERTGSEIEILLESMAQAAAYGDTTAADRDPMVPYTPPRRTTTTTAPRAPRGPIYKVTAVVIDEENPTAVLMVDGESRIVRVGEEIEGGRVTAIEHEGVTIEGDDGVAKLYSPSD
ncbi:MAG: hypothetical protein GF400_05020 [Candidatus Eisenbacteria bacterium]|nr:hypothetical protein [Candidatus Eisenbacteria bacterium]